MANILKEAVSLCERPPLGGSEWELPPTTKVAVVAFGGLRQELGHNSIVIGRELGELSDTNRLEETAIRASSIISAGASRLVGAIGLADMLEPRLFVGVPAALHKVS